MSERSEQEQPESPPAPIDPLLAQHLAPRRKQTQPTGSRDNERNTRTSSMRHHPARRARTVALLASLASTGGVATALAGSEGAFSSNDAELESPEHTVDSASSNAEPSVSTDTTASATVTSEPTESTSSVATTVATTQPEVPVTEVTAETIPESAVATSAYGDGLYLGTAEYTEWGDVQVEVTISGGAIVDVVAVQIPSGRKSSAINNSAEPLLEAQAIEMQTADLDVVSGATYTSRTYADSLQAALDQASLAASQTLEAATP